MTERIESDRPGAGGEPLGATPALEGHVRPWTSAPAEDVPTEERSNGVSAAEPSAPVPLMDPARVYGDWGPEAEAAVLDVLRSHAYVKGRHVAALEEEFAAYTGTQHAVAVDSCTDALYLVLRAVFNARPADRREVILPTFTFVATAGAVVNAGGHPVFADVDSETHNLCPETVASLVTDRTAAVIPVHLFGAPADVDAIRAAVGAPETNGHPAAPEDVFLLEDAAQSIHATLRGRRTGSLGNAGTFSFYPSKNLAAAGDGGVVTTNDRVLAAAVRALRDHGQTRKLYDHEAVGTNSRMDEIQAAVLRLKLPCVDAWTRSRRGAAARYDEAFEGTAVRPQQVVDGGESAYHLYTVRLGNRDEVADALRAADIGFGVYYPLPLHRQSCFARYEPAACPNADALAETVLSLPCFPGLTAGEQERVIEVVLSTARA